jgi:Tfp pilus assembly protein PilX
MKATKNRGSALLLVMIALIILSLIGLAALTQSGSEINTTGNFFKDKSAFYAADAGIQLGIRQIRLNSANPKLVIFDGVIGNNNYRTGLMSDTLPTKKNVKAFQGFWPPQSSGQSAGMESESNMINVPWTLVITAESNVGTRNRVRKQVQTVLTTMMPRDY